MNSSNNSRPEMGKGKPFLGILFKCCNTYGRIYKNKEQSAYEGRCPKCGRKVNFMIGTQGCDSRFFEVR